ncbi:imidazole glycerol phosphate synthase subunit HisH [Halioxenophilus aromaticivorans]|uniref:Imidazole glycerol phosphate synthase subunit HisH n=1 Tax=Halioxenophilus aromaticivorans TaxID=1306992 RepID=A0AAV3U4V7_9ALTE
MSKKIIAICDYGMGNLHSAASALEHVCADDQQVVVTSDAQVIASAERILFPGVGAVRDCMQEVKRLGFDQLVKSQIDAGKPVLGICVGMQLLLTHSEENSGVDCLNLVPGHVRFFGNDFTDEHGAKLKVPHMGWNNVFHSQDHALWKNIKNGQRFYFVHSYCVQLDNSAQELGSTEYGVKFSAGLCQNNLAAVQFHPEKSHDAGLQLLRNFCQWQP